MSRPPRHLAPPSTVTLAAEHLAQNDAHLLGGIRQGLRPGRGRRRAWTARERLGWPEQYLALVVARAVTRAELLGKRA